MTGTTRGRPATKEGSARLDHWIYGVTPGRGYGVKAQSAGLNLSFYAPRLEAHHTPIRGETAQASDGSVDVIMFHPVNSGNELLYSVVGRGPPDELGRPTYANHTAIIPMASLLSRRLSLDAVDETIRAFDRKESDALGDMNQLLVPSVENVAPLGAGIEKFLSRAAAETLLSRLLSDPQSRTLLLARDSTPSVRRRFLIRLVESLHLSAGVPLIPSISDGPSSSQLRHFQLVVSPRGLRTDNAWVLLDCVIEHPSLPRVDGEFTRYERLLGCFGR
jgi:hypothetical protein